MGLALALPDHGIPSAREAWFDAAAVEDEFQEAGTYLRVRRRDQLADDENGRLFAGTDHGAGFDVVLVEAPEHHEGAARPPRRPRSGSSTTGRPRSFCALQARIVRAGEVVRIPAGVPWRFQDTGTGLLRAVAVGTAA